MANIDSPIPQPRLHHYRFAYRWIPVLIFGSPMSAAVCRSTKEQLLKSWMIAGQQLAPDAMQPSDGLDSELLPFTPRADLLIITMPAPQHSTEAYYIGIVAPHPHDEKTIRYFVLSHSDASKNAGMAPGCIRELTSDGKNFRSMDFVKPTKFDFIVAMRVLCGDKPSGSFCVVHPRMCSQVEVSAMEAEVKSLGHALDKAGESEMLFDSETAKLVMSYIKAAAALERLTWQHSDSDELQTIKADVFKLEHELKELGDCENLFELTTAILIENYIKALAILETAKRQQRLPVNTGPLKSEILKLEEKLDEAASDEVLFDSNIATLVIQYAKAVVELGDVIIPTL